jgi:hypothetical protein
LVFLASSEMGRRDLSASLLNRLSRAGFPSIQPARTCTRRRSTAGA